MNNFSNGRRDFLKLLGSVAIAGNFQNLIEPHIKTSNLTTLDRVFISNEDSNTISVIDPIKNTVETTINLTSFDEDPRPPFRFVTGGIIPTHASMVNKPLYHGCIGAHGVIPSPDGRILATAGRGSSNIYLIDTISKKVIGNKPNPFFGKGVSVNEDIISGGIFVGREPHEATFTKNGKELWVAVRGENKIVIIDVNLAIKELQGEEINSIIKRINTIRGPSQVWFSSDYNIAFVTSQKEPKLDIFETNFDESFYSHPKRKSTIDISEQDKFGFTPFIKLSPDGQEIWLSHKLSDAISSRSVEYPFPLHDLIHLGENSRPNHLEFVENKNGKVVYVSQARVDDRNPQDVASSQIAIIDRSEKPGKRKVVKLFYSYGREAHGLWTNPDNTLLFIAHEQDELPGTKNEGQTVVTVFDVSNPLYPEFIAQIPLGYLKLPSGNLRNKKSINLVYVRTHI